jgi:hypothetical protein
MSTNTFGSETLESFIKILKQVNSGEYKVESELIKDADYNTDPEEGNLMPNLNGRYGIKDDDALSSMANKYLIENGGQPNWVNIATLKLEGFHVFATEKDSFGWLGGAISTTKGLIFFG